MSIATACQATLAMGSVNQPSPQHRSTARMPGLIPTAATTLAGCGHSSSHHGLAFPCLRKIPEIGGHDLIVPKAGKFQEKRAKHPIRNAWRGYFPIDKLW